MVLKGAYVLKDAYSSPERLDVSVENGKIVAVGKDLSGSEVLDLSGKLLAPAFYNTHTHSAMTLMRGVSDDDDFNTWLFKKVLPLEEKLNGRMVYYGTMVAMMEMARNGIAGFVDMYFFLEDIARAVLDFGMRALITRGLVDDGGDDGGRLEENVEFHKKWSGKDGRIFAGLGPHSPYTCSVGYLKRVADVARVEEMPVTIHLYEAAWERDRYDARDVLEVFDGVKIIVAHAVQFKEEEVGVLKGEEIFVSHNPSSNLKLGNGVAKVAEMVKEGVKVSFGTDGAASNNTLDIRHEMRLASLLQKMKDPTLMRVEEVLDMATRIGAMAMGVNGGVLEVGKEADIAVYDLSDPSCLPIQNLKSHLVHSSCVVYATMVKGRWVYFDGEYPNVDPKEVMRGFKKAAKELLEV